MKKKWITGQTKSNLGQDQKMEKKQERFSRGEIRSANELLSIKRPNNELIWPSPESKCKRIFNPLKQSNSGNFSSSSKAKLQLKLLNTEHDTMVDLEKMEEDIP